MTGLIPGQSSVSTSDRHIEVFPLGKLRELCNPFRPLEEMNMRKALAVIAVLSMTVLAPTATLSQTPAPSKPVPDTVLPADAPTRDQVMTLLDLLQVRRTMSAMLANMKQAAQQGAEEEFRKKVPNPTPKQLAALHGMFNDVIDMPLDEMINALIPIYQRHLTRSDIEQTIRFYSSPAGQKLLREQPKMLEEGMQAGVDIERKRMDEINAKRHERMEKLIEATSDPGPSQQ